MAKVVERVVLLEIGIGRVVVVVCGVDVLKIGFGELSFLKVGVFVFKYGMFFAKLIVVVV